VQIHDIEGRKWDSMLKLGGKQLHPGVVAKEGLQQGISIRT